jgi:hypothetical protein
MSNRLKTWVVATQNNETMVPGKNALSEEGWVLRKVSVSQDKDGKKFVDGAILCTKSSALKAAAWLNELILAATEFRPVLAKDAIARAEAEESELLALLENLEELNNLIMCKEQVMIKEIRLTRQNSSNPAYTDAAIGVVLEKNYGSSLSKFDRLFEVAQQDFPEISRETVKVVHYGGDRRAKLFGIEFEIPYEVTIAPAGWTPIVELEMTK